MRPPSTLLQLNAILVLFCAAAMLFTNEADGQQDTLGLGGFPVPTKGEVDLPSGIVLVNDKDKFDEYYKDAKVKPCNVDFDKEGNIEVLYDNLASTKGCTLDLLVNDNKEIKFAAKVEDKEKNCVTEEINDNLLPFIFNEANNRLAALTNGPEYGGDEFCADKTKCELFEGRGKCIKRTMFEIGWRLNGLIEGIIERNLLQVGEPVDAWFVLGKSDEAKLDVKMAVGNVPDDKPLVTITALDVQGATSVEFPGTKPAGQPICNYPRKATPPPAIWKVNSGEFKDKYFVTFHFFPQKSTDAGGPKCKEPKQPYFIFSKDYASILMMAMPTTTTKVTTTIGSTSMETTRTSLTNTMGIGSTKMTTIGSTKMTTIGSTKMTTIGSTKMTTLGSTKMTTIGSTKMTTLGSTKMTTIGSTKTTTIGSTKTTMGTGSTAPTANKTSSAPPPAPGTTKPTGGLTGATVGIVAGSVLLLIIALFVIWCCCCRVEKGADVADIGEREDISKREDISESEQTKSSSRSSQPKTRLTELDWKNYETIEQEE